MIKVKNIWYAESGSDELSAHYATGLVLELENGTLLEQLSTDAIQPYAVVKDKRLAFGAMIPKAPEEGSQND